MAEGLYYRTGLRDQVVIRILTLNWEGNKWTCVKIVASRVIEINDSERMLR